MIAFNRFELQERMPQNHVTRFVEYARDLLETKRDADKRIVQGDDDDFFELSARLVTKLAYGTERHWPVGLTYPICLIAELAACLVSHHRGLEPVAAIRPILQSLYDALREEIDRSPVTISERKRQEADFGIVKFCAAELKNRESLPEV